MVIEKKKSKTNETAAVHRRTEKEHKRNSLIKRNRRRMGRKLRGENQNRHIKRERKNQDKKVA